MEWKADWGLRARMGVTMLLLGVLYIVFIGVLASLGAGPTLIVGVMGLFMLGQFFFSDKLALYSMGAKEVDREEYPELRTDEKFGDVRDSLQTIEGRLENRREYYNEAVMRYNATLERVPERYIAARRGYEPREPFEASEQANDDFSIRGRLAASEDR